MTASVASVGALVAPRSIAVIGVSGNRTAAANYAIRNLRASAYAGELHAVHRSAATVEGIEVAPAISSLPHDIDLALVSVPAAGVVDALTELATIQCQAAIVPAVGLSHDDKEALVSLVKRSGMKVCGPNTMGIINVTDGIPMVFWPGVLSDVRAGGVALVAQSGGACIAVVRSTERAGFSRIIPSGSEWAVTSAEYLEWLSEDQATDAVGLVLESINDVTGFEEAVRKLRERDKRLVVLRTGRTPRGAVAASAHTGALVGQPEAYAALFEDLDVPVVDDLDELAAVLEAFSAGSPPAAGDRIGVVTTSGGMAALAADLASEGDINLAQLEESTRVELSDLVEGVEVLNPFDAGGGSIYSDELFRAVIRCIARDPAVDSVMTVIDAQAALNESEIEISEEDFAAVILAAEAITDKPLVAASTSAAGLHQRLIEFPGAEGLPLVRGIGSAFAVLRSLAMNRKALAPAAQRPQDEAATPARTAALARVRSSDNASWPQATAELLEAYAIPRVRSMVVSNRAAALQPAAEIGYPLVAKVVSQDIPHRSDVGGVVVAVADEVALRAALAQIETDVHEANPSAAIDGYEIQEHVLTRLEALVGAINDPTFGPVVVVGSGGVLVELFNDLAFARAPVDTEKARQLIGATRLAATAGGYRGLTAATDLEPLAAVVAALSQLAFDLSDTIAEIDLNPVLIEEGSGRVRVADSLFVRVPG